MKIITVTLNPCIDANYCCPVSFQVGALYRFEKPDLSYNGKGINVSRQLHRLGRESVAMMLLPGADGIAMQKSLEAEGLHVCGVPTGGSLRRNTSILDADGVQTQLNELGAPVCEDELSAFISLYKQEVNCPDETTVLLCGSLPPGAPVDFYRKLCVIAKNCGARVILDADGAALEAGISAMPDLIKPNREEFEKLSGTVLEGHGEGLRISAVRAVLEYYRNTCSAVLCTLGEEGSVYAGPEGSYLCAAVPANIRTFKGAGDIFLASFVDSHYAKGAACDAAMMRASAASAAYMSGETTREDGRNPVQNPV